MPEQSQICGHQLSSSELPTGVFPTTCDRPIWNSTGSCIWHAESPDKSIEELVAQEPDEGARIDGAVLSDMHMVNSDSLTGYQLVCADFSGTELTEADLSNTDLRNTDFSNATLDHAKFGARTNAEDSNFSEASLVDTRFQNTRLTNSEFRKSHALSVNFNESRLMEADFHQSDLRDANFQNANLRAADITNANLMNANLQDVNLERADLSESDLRESSLVGIQQYECDMRDIRVDHRTDFGRMCIYEASADESSESKINTNLFRYKAINALPRWTRRFIHRLIDADVDTTGQNSENSDKDRLKRAVWVYRDLQRILKENSLPAEHRQFSIREKHARRKLAHSKREPVNWFRLALSHRGMLYGESAWYVVRTSLLVVGMFSCIYALEGLQNEANGTVYSFVPRLEFSWEATESLIQFSITRFLTASSGHYEPIGIGGFAATIESALGAFLLALFVFVLGRRATQ